MNGIPVEVRQSPFFDVVQEDEEDPKEGSSILTVTDNPTAGTEKNVKLQNANLSTCQIENANLSICQIENANLSICQTENANLSTC